MSNSYNWKVFYSNSRKNWYSNQLLHANNQYHEKLSYKEHNTEQNNTIKFRSGDDNEKKMKIKMFSNNLKMDSLYVAYNKNI